MEWIQFKSTPKGSAQKRLKMQPAQTEAELEVTPVKQGT